MNEKEYLFQLRHLLDSSDLEDTDDLMETFKEHFADGHAEGKTDEEIIEELGDPESIYAELASSQDQQKVKLSWGAERLLEWLGIHGKFDNWNKEPAEEEYQTITEAGTVDTVQWVERCGADIRLIRGELLGYVWRPRRRGGQCVIETSGQDDHILSIRPETEGILFLEVPEQIIRFIGDFFDGDINMRNIELEQLSLTGQGGDVQLDCCVADDCKISLISGDIDIHTMRILKGTMETRFGDVELEKLVPDDVSVKTNSGDIQLSKVKGNKLEVTSGSGDITGQLDVDNVAVTSTSGDVTLHLNCENGKVDSNSGDLRITSTKPFDSLWLNDISGDIDMAVPDPHMLSFVTAAFNEIENECGVPYAHFPDEAYLVIFDRYGSIRIH